MFKRGELVEGGRGVWFVSGEGELTVIKEPDRKYGDKTTYSINGHSLKPYTGPIYENDVQRFVPSGEFRRPLKGEWCWIPIAKYVFKAEHDFQGKYSDDPSSGYRPILLPTPKLPDEECSLCRGHGVCRHCVPEHEFKVEDWVKWEHGGRSAIHQVVKIVNRDIVAYNSGSVLVKNCTKLPGRPLTIDDLIRLCGNVVFVGY